MVALRIVLSLFAAIALSCTGAVNAQDQQRLLKLEQRFGDRYTFEFNQGIYLNAKRHASGIPTRSEAEEIYRLFWFDNDQRFRSSTSFTYLNVYDQAGRFQFQIYWNATDGQLRYSDSEHY